jgi:hypothetical protein
MRIAIGLAALAALISAAPVLAQTSLTRPRSADQELQDLNALTLQRQQDAVRQQQRAFDQTQRELEAERQGAIPILPSDPDYRGSMFRR